MFDKTLATTYRWLDHLGSTLGWDDRERSYRALRAVLHALRDRLPVEEAVDLGASLPMLVRGFYYEGWRPAATPRRYRDKNHFIEQVQHDAPWLNAEDAESVVAGTFALLAAEIGGAEPEHVRRRLPPEIRELWARPGM
jgi:uncharacterized protein (DUF2267 family)